MQGSVQVRPPRHSLCHRYGKHCKTVCVCSSACSRPSQINLSQCMSQQWQALQDIFESSCKGTFPLGTIRMLSCQYVVFTICTCMAFPKVYDMDCATCCKRLCGQLILGESGVDWLHTSRSAESGPASCTAALNQIRLSQSLCI